MLNTRAWDWPESGVKRRADTVGKQILWSYSGLTVTRQQMRAYDSTVFPFGRGRATQREFGLYVRGEKAPGSLERETRIQAFSTARCVHCGAAAASQMDHLIPRSRGGGDMPFNTVTSCRDCNLRRGNRDLMRWYRDRHDFPCLALLRHYLKLCHRVAHGTGLADFLPEVAVAAGLPFDSRLLPTRYPPPELLVWDWRFPGRR